MEENKTKKVKTTEVVQEETAPINCLQKKRVIVRYIQKHGGIWGDNPKHVFAGGMAETAHRTFVVPKLSSGLYSNILTDNEKDYLENIMGLEPNTMSVYKKVNNFWDDANEDGINSVTLYKNDNYLDLSVPEDYIRYKILLANKNLIAPSMEVLEDFPKATYQFVIIDEQDENKVTLKNMNSTMMAYKEFGKIEDNKDILRQVIETMEGRPTAPTVKLDYLKAKANDLIQQDSKRFVSIVQDPLLNIKITIKKAIEEGIIVTRNNLLFLKKDNLPLCENGEEATLNTAAKYLSAAKRQELLFSIQAQLK